MARCACPASLCGLYGLKPASAPRSTCQLAGTFPFAESFDDDRAVCPASLADLALVWGVLRGEPVTPCPSRAAASRGWARRFRENADPAQLAAIDAIAPDAPLIDLPDVARARSAAFVITAYEGGHLHRGRAGGERHGL